MIAYYRCPECHEDWDEEYECACDSTCPYCGEEDVEAYDCSPGDGSDLVPEDWGCHGGTPEPGATPPEGEEVMNGSEVQDGSTGLYEVSALKRPTVLAAQGGAVSEVILPPTTVVASGRSSAIAIAARKIASTVTDTDLQRVDWMVRRFKGDNA
jgi:hypothetical protein